MSTSASNGVRQDSCVAPVPRRRQSPSAPRESAADASMVRGGVLRDLLIGLGLPNTADALLKELARQQSSEGMVAATSDPASCPSLHPEAPCEVAVPPPPPPPSSSSSCSGVTQLDHRGTDDAERAAADPAVPVPSTAIGHPLVTPALPSESVLHETLRELLISSVRPPAADRLYQAVETLAEVIVVRSLEASVEMLTGALRTLGCELARTAPPSSARTIALSAEELVAYAGVLWAQQLVAEEVSCALLECRGDDWQQREPRLIESVSALEVALQTLLRVLHRSVNDGGGNDDDDAVSARAFLLSAGLASRQNCEELSGWVLKRCTRRHGSSDATPDDGLHITWWNLLGRIERAATIASGTDMHVGLYDSTSSSVPVVHAGDSTPRSHGDRAPTEMTDPLRCVHLYTRFRLVAVLVLSLVAAVERLVVGDVAAVAGTVLGLWGHAAQRVVAADQQHHAVAPPPVKQLHASIDASLRLLMHALHLTEGVQAAEAVRMVLPLLLIEDAASWENGDQAPCNGATAAYRLYDAYQALLASLVTGRKSAAHPEAAGVAVAARPQVVNSALHVARLHRELKTKLRNARCLVDLGSDTTSVRHQLQALQHPNWLQPHSHRSSSLNVSAESDPQVSAATTREPSASTGAPGEVPAAVFAARSGTDEVGAVAHHVILALSGEDVDLVASVPVRRVETGSSSRSGSTSAFVSGRQVGAPHRTSRSPDVSGTDADVEMWEVDEATESAAGPQRMEVGHESTVGDHIEHQHFSPLLSAADVDDDDDDVEAEDDEEVDTREDGDEHDDDDDHDSAEEEMMDDEDEDDATDSSGTSSSSSSGAPGDDGTGEMTPEEVLHVAVTPCGSFLAVLTSWSRLAVYALRSARREHAPVGEEAFCERLILLETLAGVPQRIAPYDYVSSFLHFSPDHRFVMCAVQYGPRMEVESRMAVASVPACTGLVHIYSLHDAAAFAGPGDVDGGDRSSVSAAVVPERATRTRGGGRVGDVMHWLAERVARRRPEPRTRRLSGEGPVTAAAGGGATQLYASHAVHTKPVMLARWVDPRFWGGGGGSGSGGAGWDAPGRVAAGSWRAAASRLLGRYQCVSSAMDDLILRWLPSTGVVLQRIATLPIHDLVVSPLMQAFYTINDVGQLSMYDAWNERDLSAAPEEHVSVGQRGLPATRSMLCTASEVEERRAGNALQDVAPLTDVDVHANFFVGTRIIRFDRAGAAQRSGTGDPMHAKVWALGNRSAPSRGGSRASRLGSRILRRLLREDDDAAEKQEVVLDDSGEDHGSGRDAVRHGDGSGSGSFDDEATGRPRDGDRHRRAREPPRPRGPRGAVASPSPSTAASAARGAEAYGNAVVYRTGYRLTFDEIGHALCVAAGVSPALADPYLPDPPAPYHLLSLAVSGEPVWRSPKDAAEAVPVTAPWSLQPPRAAPDGDDVPGGLSGVREDRGRRRTYHGRRARGGITTPPPLLAPTAANGRYLFLVASVGPCRTLVHPERALQYQPGMYLCVTFDVLHSSVVRVIPVCPTQPVTSLTVNGTIPLYGHARKSPIYTLSCTAAVVQPPDDSAGTAGDGFAEPVVLVTVGGLHGLVYTYNALTGARLRVTDTATSHTQEQCPPTTDPAPCPTGLTRPPVELLSQHRKRSRYLMMAVKPRWGGDGTRSHRCGMRGESVNSCGGRSSNSGGGSSRWSASGSSDDLTGSGDGPASRRTSGSDSAAPLTGELWHFWTTQLGAANVVRAVADLVAVVPSPMNTHYAAPPWVSSRRDVGAAAAVVADPPSGTAAADGVPMSQLLPLTPAEAAMCLARLAAVTEASGPGDPDATSGGNVERLLEELRRRIAGSQDWPQSAPGLAAGAGRLLIADPKPIARVLQYVVGCLPPRRQQALGVLFPSLSPWRGAAALGGEQPGHGAAAPSRTLTEPSPRWCTEPFAPQRMTPAASSSVPPPCPSSPPWRPERGSSVFRCGVVNAVAGFVTPGGRYFVFTGDEWGRVHLIGAG